jgi:hypothetical protein
MWISKFISLSSQAWLKTNAKSDGKHLSEAKKQFFKGAKCFCIKMLWSLSCFLLMNYLV